MGPVIRNANSASSRLDFLFCVLSSATFLNPFRTALALWGQMNPSSKYMRNKYACFRQHVWVKLLFLFFFLGRNSTVFGVSCFLFLHVSQKPRLTYLVTSKKTENTSLSCRAHGLTVRWVFVWWLTAEMTLNQPSAFSFVAQQYFP